MRPIPLHPATTRSVLAFALGLLIVGAPSDALAQDTAPAIPTPESVFGFAPGTDRKLANWTELTGFYERLAQASPRVLVDTLGATTEGHPFVMLTVSSPSNLERIDELHSIQMKLADPRTVSGDEELAALLEHGRTVVLITHAIHSTEVGSAQSAARLLHHLATSRDPAVLEILDNVILLDIPSLNPDGTEWVVDWYNSFVGTEYEAAPMPWLYHSYVGHDNNRDWYAFTQRETWLTVTGAHNAWHPHIVHDIHQMGGAGARIFFPPYIDPIERNIDPALVAAVNQLGTWMAAELTSQGKEGVVVDAIYDGFTPARAYQHYHAGARILSETASARLATPVEVAPGDLAGRRGYDATTASANYPDPWPGGRWGLPEIVEYQTAGAMALLTNASRNRRFWLENFYRINKRAVEGWDEWPSAWVIPADQTNPVGLAYVLRILATADVEVFKVESPVRADGHVIAAGSHVVLMNQPYASFAQTMLEVQEYPDLREYPGGPPRRPYDVTAHTLGLLMDVETYPVESLDPAFGAGLAPEPIAAPEFAWALPASLSGDAAPRVGMYKSWREPMEAGWTRWVFDQHGLQYDTVKDARVREGTLSRDFDVLVLQDQSPGSILNGYAPGVLPDEYTGGLGEDGAAALEAFVREGGRVVAIEGATELLIDIFDLPVRNVVERLPSQDFYVPGSILELELDPSSGLNVGMGERTPAWYWGSSRAFEVDHPNARIAARYAEGNPLLSGWILGAEHLAGQAAVVEIPIGEGSVVLFGFQPNYRAQTVATWPMLFNAMNNNVVF